MTYRYRDPHLHQEPDGVPASKFMLAVFAVLVIGGVIIVWAVDMTQGWAHELRPSGAFSEKWLGPRHPVARVREDLFDAEEPLSASQARVRRTIETYGWANQERGVVRIPIDRAMDLFVAGRRP